MRDHTKLQKDLESSGGFVPRGLPRVRHTGGSRYPEGPDWIPPYPVRGRRVKPGMTIKEKRLRGHYTKSVVLLGATGRRPTKVSGVYQG